METSGVYFGSLKTFVLSFKLVNIRIGTSYSELERPIHIFVHITCYPETKPILRIVKLPCHGLLVVLFSSAVQ